MRYSELKGKVNQPVFFDYQVERLFRQEPKNQINVQLSRMVRRGDLIRLKRGVFLFPESQVDEFVVANVLYSPSYVSLESVLSGAGIIPETVDSVTSVSPVTSKKISNTLGVFLYSKINRSLFFGFTQVYDPQSSRYYQAALPEKALLDWLYIRQIKPSEDLRINKEPLDMKLLLSFAEQYPEWIRKGVNE